VINKIDIAQYVGASLEVMDRDSKLMRKERPYVFTNVRGGEGVEKVERFIIERGGLAA
jgi:urease accessory protein